MLASIHIPSWETLWQGHGPVRTYFPKQPTVVVTTTPYVKTMFLGAQGTPTHCSWVRRNTADIFVFPSCLETWWDFDMLNVDCLETWQDLSPWPSASNTASKCPGSFGGRWGRVSSEKSLCWTQTCPSPCWRKSNFSLLPGDNAVYVCCIEGERDRVSFTEGFDSA